MCWMQAAAMGAQIGFGNMQQNQANAGSVDQTRRQAIEMVKEMNIKDANLRLKTMDTLDTASQDLTLQNMQKVQAMGSIRSAVGEGNLTGNSMNRIKNVTEGDFVRAANGVNDQYQRDYAAIFAERLGNRNSTVSQIEQMQKSEPRIKSMLEMVLDPLDLGIGKALIKTSGKVVPGGKGFDRTLNRALSGGSSNTIDPHSGK